MEPTPGSSKAVILELEARIKELEEALQAMWGANERQQPYLPARELARAALGKP